MAQEYADAVIKQEECIFQGNARKGNQYARRYIQIANQLLRGGEEAISVFVELLQHPDPNVRGNAAANLLKVRTAEAVAALEPLAEIEGLTGLGAKMTLERYRRGELEIK
ncbi:MAG: HEAT repeat domain-containing protein [Blastocatellales bacterium]